MTARDALVRTQLAAREISTEWQSQFDDLRVRMNDYSPRPTQPLPDWLVSQVKPGWGGLVYYHVVTADVKTRPTRATIQIHFVVFQGYVGYAAQVRDGDSSVETSIYVNWSELKQKILQILVSRGILLQTPLKRVVDEAADPNKVYRMLSNIVGFQVTKDNLSAVAAYRGSHSDQVRKLLKLLPERAVFSSANPSQRASEGKHGRKPYQRRIG